MAAVRAVLLETVKCFGAPLLRRIGYVKNLKKNFKKLNKEAEKLYAMRDDKQTEVNRSSPGKVRSSQFELWIKEVEEIENQTNAIEEYFKQEKKCCSGCCPDICSRMKIGKDIVNLINSISELKKFDGEVMIDAPPSTVEEIPVPRIEGRTLIHNVRKVLGFIEDPGIKMIGICGMGGIGKTMLMKNINNLPEIAQMFDIVIWVTVSRDWSLRMVQNEVAQRLSLNLPKLPIDMSDDGVSRKLYDRLRNSKYLLLLDDVWERLNLEEVGIPIPNEENGCKIVLTTRDLQICHKMGTDKQISVEVLSEEEAWELFRVKAGSIIDSPEIQALARGVVKECGGLPLAIIVVGGALREEGDVRVWKNALRELGSAVMTDMEEVVFKQLRFSYDRLKGVRKSCFLYGALYPEDAEIPVEELIEYWRAAGFLEDDGGTVESLAGAVDAGHAILKDLVDASLLEKYGKDYMGRECVKMHDVIRDLALRITSIEAVGGNDNKYKFLVRAGKGIETPPREEQWKECNAVSLMRNKLQRLPERAVCPVLSTLLLQFNGLLQDIPESFFEAMPALQVLDLSYTGIRSLPPSICNLVHLRGMYLNQCWALVELPPEIGAVKALEVLQIGGHTPIPGLPITVGELTRLKCLHVLFSLSRAGGDGEMMMMIPQGIVSRLSLLEDLRIQVDGSSEWDWDRNLKEDYVVEEVCNLTKLTRLDFCFTRVEYLKRFIDMSGPWLTGQLLSFSFIVSPPLQHYFNDPRPAGRMLKFVGGDGAPPQAIKQVLCRAESFLLGRHSSIKNLLGEFGMENMTHLKYLKVEECPGIESILIDMNCSFPNLELLEIGGMLNLRDIWGDQLVVMVNLRVLKLYDCGRLQKVLPRSQLLPNLEELFVVSCNEMKEIIGEEGDAIVEYINNALPKLKTLKLLSLPKLEIICNEVLAWPSLEKIDIQNCENLRRLPFGIHNTSTLKKIECSSKAWWDALQWEDDEIKTQLQPFASFPMQMMEIPPDFIPDIFFSPF